MSLLYSPTFKYSDVQLRKNHLDFMDSNTYHHPQQELQQQHQHQHQQQHQHNSGLMRYRSAPSSVFANLLDGSINGGEGGVGCEDYRDLRSSNPEVETMLARFMTPCNGSGDSNSQMVYQAQTAQQVQALPNHNSVGAGTTLDSSFSGLNSVGLENSMQAKMGAGNRSNLVRQSSSPSLFSDLTIDNGFAVMRDVGTFRACNGTNGEASPSMTKLNDHLSFTARRLPQIAEIGNEITSPEDQSLGNANGSNQQYIPKFTSDSWDESTLNSLRRARDNEVNMFPTSNALETQNADSGNHTHRLTHHLSLPKTSVEMATIEKFLQFQGSVPCKIRAKRGCATHPRSIAERVRRTRISERMRKLQELFPNMDKQTNTADMLDLAVEYIKDLQKQVKTLTDTKAKCSCSRKQKQCSNHSA
ncbi:hypothetical protein ACB094_11G183400 [Castanea mollissima]